MSGGLLTESAISFTCSAAAIAITYPADTISRRQQVSISTLSVKQLIRSGGLFKGLGPAIGTQPVYWAINMPLYNSLKKHALEQTFYPQYVHFVYSPPQN